MNDPTKARRLLAGSAQVDITPRAGIPLAGNVGLYRPARLIEDPLYAKALMLEYEGRRICIVTLDVTIITRKYTEMIRQTAVDRFGLEHDAIMVHAIQDHSAPSVGHIMVDDDFTGIPDEYSWIKGSDESYNIFAVEGALEAICLADSMLQPVQIGVGSGIEGRVAFNRRAVKQDGTVGMPGYKWEGSLGPAWIRYLEGPIDPELGVMCLRNDSMDIVSMLLHYSCHPVNAFHRPVVSADWPGALSAEMKKHYGNECVPLVLNGACGNINPWDPFDPDYESDQVRMGRILAETTEKVLDTLVFKDERILDWKVKNIKIPIREIEPETLESARKMLDEYPEPKWTDESRKVVDFEWMRAASIWSVHICKQRDPMLDYEIQVLRIGDTAIVGLPGEPFVEGQLELKIKSPTYPTYVAHCTSHYVGYIPTKEAFGRGGHEASIMYWSKLTPDALDMVVSGAVECLNEVFQS